MTLDTETVFPGWRKCDWPREMYPDAEIHRDGSLAHSPRQNKIVKTLQLKKFCIYLSRAKKWTNNRPNLNRMIHSTLHEHS